MKFLTTSLLVFSLCISAFAKETKICTIVSDLDAEQTELMIETDSQGDLDSIRLYKTVGESVVYDATHSVEAVIEDGIVAAQIEGRDVINLKANKFSPSQGGIISIDYLYNGIKNERKVYNLKLTRSANKYVLSTTNGDRVNHIKVISNKLLGKVIGVKALEVSFH